MLIPFTLLHFFYFTPAYRISAWQSALARTVCRGLRFLMCQRVLFNYCCSRACKFKATLTMPRPVPTSVLNIHLRKIAGDRICAIGLSRSLSLSESIAKETTLSTTSGAREHRAGISRRKNCNDTASRAQWNEMQKVFGRLPGLV